MAKNISTAEIEPLETLIARAAYYKAEKRGFIPGHEEEDWLAAEREVCNELETPAVKSSSNTRKSRSRIRSAINKISSSAKKKKA